MYCIPSPWLGQVSVGALVTVGAGGVVLALALEQVRVVFRRRADVGMPVAHATTSHADLLDGVVILCVGR